MVGRTSPSTSVPEVRRVADDAAADPGPGDELHAGLAVVGAAAVLLHPAAELAHGHQQHLVRVAGVVQRGEEPGDARGQVAEQGGVVLGLVGVGVESPGAHQDDLGAQPQVDEVGRHRQPLRDGSRPRRVCRRWAEPGRPRPASPDRACARPTPR